MNLEMFNDQKIQTYINNALRIAATLSVFIVVWFCVWMGGIMLTVGQMAWLPCGWFCFFIGMGFFAFVGFLILGFTQELYPIPGHIYRK